ncbi:MAG: NAD(P)-binding domain-containing protein [Woeseiaceae bacterium]|nr:NAD(P)-binding domain-containing protein [Woeseiaceae bacterium]
MKRLATFVFCTLAVCTGVNGNAADMETVAVIGTGDMGDSLGPRLAGLGYQVIYGSRSPDSDRVKALVERTGNNASATTQMAAAKQGDIVLLLVPWPPMETVAQSLGDLSGKIVVDVSMPLEQAEDGYPKHMLETSSAEMIQGWNPGARVVKAFATMGAYLIDDPTAAGGMVTHSHRIGRQAGERKSRRHGRGHGARPRGFRAATHGQVHRSIAIDIHDSAVAKPTGGLGVLISGAATITVVTCPAEATWKGWILLTTRTTWRRSSGER